MKKGYKEDNFYTEIEVQKYFYGYTQEDLTGKTYVGIGDRLTVESRAPSGDSCGVSMLVKEDVDLLYYSVVGVQALDIYTNLNEKSEYKQALREAKKELLN